MYSTIVSTHTHTLCWRIRVRELRDARRDKKLMDSLWFLHFTVLWFLSTGHPNGRQTDENLLDKIYWCIKYVVTNTQHGLLNCSDVRHHTQKRLGLSLMHTHTALVRSFSFLGKLLQSHGKHENNFYRHVFRCFPWIHRMRLLHDDTMMKRSV